MDYNYVLKYMDDIYMENKWFKGEVCFDRALATWLRYQLETKGYCPVDIPQGKLTLSEPTKDFRARVYDGKIIHNNNPVLTWAVSNAIIREDHNGNIQLDKSKSKERIDPIAALLNAFVRALVTDIKFVYEKRGMRSLL